MVLYHGGKDPYEGPQYTTGVLGLTKQLKSLDKPRAPGKVQYAWGSWSGTKQLKPLDMSRAPGHGPGYPCLVLVWDQAVKAPRYV
jgi:hypothetical protein